MDMLVELKEVYNDAVTFGTIQKKMEDNIRLFKEACKKAEIAVENMGIDLVEKQTRDKEDDVLQLYYSTHIDHDHQTHHSYRSRIMPRSFCDKENEAKKVLEIIDSFDLKGHALVRFYRNSPSFEPSSEYSRDFRIVGHKYIRKSSDYLSLKDIMKKIDEELLSCLNHDDKVKLVKFLNSKGGRKYSGEKPAPAIKTFTLPDYVVSY